MVIPEKNLFRIMLKNYPEVLDIKQLCTVLDVSKKTAYKFIKEKKMH